MAQDQRTIFNREVPFPMRDPFSPVLRARIPVPGLNRFPGRANLLGRHYFGLDEMETVDNATNATPGKVVAFNAEPVKVVNGGDGDEVAGFSGFADVGQAQGFGFSPDTQLPPAMIALPGAASGDGSGDDGGGGIDWGAIINAGIHAAPAIIQAAEGQGAPWNYYNQAIGTTQARQPAPAGYAYNAANQLVPLASAGALAGGLGVGVAQVTNSLGAFVTQNPLLVLGSVMAVVLLMSRPPGRR